VGTVFVAVAFEDGVVVRELALTGDRSSIRRETVARVLELVAGVVGGTEDSHPLDR
jgi:nicotinamide mononucleotide (NMN) deamidase PncC